MFRTSGVTKKSFLKIFIDYANKYQLPAILHIRSGAKEEFEYNRCNIDADKDAISILKKHPLEFGAVYHCFDGDIAKSEELLRYGSKLFGIGGKIFMKRN